ncbi:MAG TPA: pentapeptide repeat-containing protein, partial [Porticoccaceae bacterium]|nr:pentapeptide repeat-containing protein [Porticoccaceae bacterium]
MDYCKLPSYLAKIFCILALPVATNVSAYDETDFLRVKRLNRCQNCSLSYVDFEDANLSGADLSGAKLTGADLTGANLS